MFTVHLFCLYITTLLRLHHCCLYYYYWIFHPVRVFTLWWFRNYCRIMQSLSSPSLFFYLTFCLFLFLCLLPFSLFSFPSLTLSFSSFFFYFFSFPLFLLFSFSLKLSISQIFPFSLCHYSFHFFLRLMYILFCNFYFICVCLNFHISFIRL